MLHALNAKILQLVPDNSHALGSINPTDPPLFQTTISPLWRPQHDQFPWTQTSRAAHQTAAHSSMGNHQRGGAGHAVKLKRFFANSNLIGSREATIVHDVETSHVVGERREQAFNGDGDLGWFAIFFQRHVVIFLSELIFKTHTGTGSAFGN